MKKVFSLVLVLAMAMSFSATAFAVTTDSTATIDISATYKSDIVVDDVISVDISWGSMGFEYTDSSAGVWNPATHEYESTSEGSWTSEGNEIALANHSNVGVKAVFEYTKAIETVTGTFSKGELTLATAVGTAREEAPSETVSLTLGGTLTAETAGKVGTVTVSISKQ